jgi:hypothetical protein
MTFYVRNRSCPCVRCRAGGLIGAAMLITLGILLLLHTYNVVRFGQSSPVLLLVFGAILLVARTGSTEGHIERGWVSGVTPPPPSPAEPQEPQVKL